VPVVKSLVEEDIDVDGNNLLHQSIALFSSVLAEMIRESCCTEFIGTGM
jgi:hypothetical protein